MRNGVSTDGHPMTTQFAHLLTRHHQVASGREPDDTRYRIDLGLPPLSVEDDRVMLCGSEAMNADVKALLESRGFTEGSNNSPGTYVVEKAFVTK